MKSIKKICSLLLLMVFICQIHQVQAGDKQAGLPVYQDTISAISLEYSNAMLNGDITLANGALLHIIDYKTRDDNTMNQWQPGDVVVFNTSVQKEKLILGVQKFVNGKVDDTVEPYVIFDNINSPQTSLSIAEIKEGGKFIKLSDNSVWEFSFFNHFATEDWSVGERVLVAGRGDKNSYKFINLDVPVKHNSCTAMGTFVVD